MYLNLNTVLYNLLTSFIISALLCARPTPYLLHNSRVWGCDIYNYNDYQASAGDSAIMHHLRTSCICHRPSWNSYSFPGFIFKNIRTLKEEHTSKIFCYQTVYDWKSLMLIIFYIVEIYKKEPIYRIRWLLIFRFTLFIFYYIKKQLCLMFIFALLIRTVVLSTVSVCLILLTATKIIVLQMYVCQKFLCVYV